VSSENRKRDFEVVKNNFDANIEKERQKSDYNIVISSEVLAEGVNLHRANVIVNYDSPWNATRLMQRIGRVNRIGSVAGEIYNYMFYPSQQGNEQIQLYENALIKLQGFHSALGEDAQIYSREEIVKEFQLFNPKIKDRQDKQLELLREVRDLYNSDRALYKKIKELPMKSRTTREANSKADAKTTIAFIQSPLKTEYYIITDKNEVKSIDFLDAAEILRAKKEELPADFSKVAETHFLQVNRALKEFENESIIQQDSDSIAVMQTTDKKALEAQKFLREYAKITQEGEVKIACNTLANLINRGAYSQLPKELKNISRQYFTVLFEKQYEIDKLISALYEKYNNDSETASDINNTAPAIVISETFA
jgi:superfamily II DNA/RNA helicase